MASSNKLMQIALLVAFAMVAPMLPTSAAARDGGAAKAAAAPAPAPSGEEALHPRGFLDDIIGDIIGWIPDLPLPRILPCPPEFPKIPLIPCYNVTVTTPVTECRTTLAKYMSPCAGYLTDTSVPSPPRNCCATTHQIIDDRSTTLLCICHVVNGDVGEVWKAPVNSARANSYLQQCGFELSAERFTRICTDRDSGYDVPPMDAPSPPPPSHGTNAGSP